MRFNPDGRYADGITGKASRARSHKRIQNPSLGLSGGDLLLYPFRRKTGAVPEPPVNGQPHVVDEGGRRTAICPLCRLGKCIIWGVDDVWQRQLASSGHFILTSASGRFTTTPCVSSHHNVRGGCRNRVLRARRTNVTNGTPIVLLERPALRCTPPCLPRQLQNLSGRPVSAWVSCRRRRTPRGVARS